MRRRRSRCRARVLSGWGRTLAGCSGIFSGVRRCRRRTSAASGLRDRTTLATILGAAGNTEADFTNYARKTGITGTVTTDTANNRQDVDMPDQTWTAAGGATNNTLVKAIIYYQDSAADSGRIPLVGLDFAVTTDGTDLTMQLNAAGFYRAAAA
jgi:hypothetical protein